MTLPLISATLLAEPPLETPPGGSGGRSRPWEALGEPWEALGQLWEGLGELWDSPVGIHIYQKLPINRPSGRYVKYTNILRE